MVEDFSSQMKCRISRVKQELLLRELPCANDRLVKQRKNFHLRFSKMDEEAEKLDLLAIFYYQPAFRPPIQVGFLRAMFFNHV